MTCERRCFCDGPDYREIYRRTGECFNCRGEGWSTSQDEGTAIPKSCASALASILEQLGGGR